MLLNRFLHCHVLINSFYYHINQVANLMEQPLFFMIFHNSYCLHKNKKNNNRKAGELNPALLGERQLCLPHNHENTMLNYQNLKVSFSLKILEIPRIFRVF